MKSNTKISTGPTTRSFLAGMVVFCAIFLNSYNGSAQLVNIPDPAFRLFLQQAYPSTMSGNNLIIANAGSTMGYFNCSNKNILNVFGVQYFTNVDSVNISHNNIPAMSQYLSAANFKTFNCSYNKFTVLPLLLFSPSVLKIDCSNNNLISLPSFSTTPNLNIFNCSNNNLTFEDLLRVPASVTSFVYAPQADLVIPEVVELEEGDTYTLKYPADDTVTSNVYGVRKNGILISTQPGNVFQINNVTASDTGMYLIVAANPNFPGLGITTNYQKLYVKNKNNEIFTPDGDGNQDSYYLPFIENIRIYNHAGFLIKEMQGPSYWDGTDSAGKPLRTGTYIIRSGDKEVVVTLIR